MTMRPVFIALSDYPFVEVMHVEFQWFPGFAPSQKKKSITALHEAALSKNRNLKMLEISTKSEERIGQKLSAFNLKMKMQNGKSIFMECAFQGSKYFSEIGQNVSLYEMDPRDAKRIAREHHEKHRLEKFVFDGKEFPLEPKTLFYDWLYMQCALTSIGDFSVFTKYNAYTDIEFNPNKSINCQAYSLAMLSSLMNHYDPMEVLDMSIEKFKGYYNNNVLW